MADRRRCRDLGIAPGQLPTGPLNAITDVAGVRVGHVTLNEGAAIRTGVTAILPHDGNLFRSRVPAAVFVGNGFGKLAGSTQVEELGELETPIILTNTLAVGTAVQAVVRYTLDQPGNEDVRSVNALVGETNDGFLNDIRGMHVREEHIRAALEGAAAGPVVEGSVGAGTGTSCFGWKGGIGTSSRRTGAWTVGALVQSNYGGLLTVDGAAVGQELVRDGQGPGDGSCMIVLATDAPLCARNLRRLAARAMVGLARTGSWLANGSGDYAVAFSTGWRIDRGEEPLLPPVATVANGAMSDPFQAAAEATEEALLNSLFMATAVVGRDGNRREALPLDRVAEICRRANRQT